LVDLTCFFLCSLSLPLSLFYGAYYIVDANRDIKGANILVDQEGTVKLADFGMAKHVNCVLYYVILHEN
jgi:hypothetical protein